MSQSKELFPEVFCPQRDPEGVSGRNIMTAAVPKTLVSCRDQTEEAFSSSESKRNKK